MTSRDDEAWRRIVEGYGDRPDFPDDPPAERDAAADGVPGPDALTGAPAGALHGRIEEAPDERFVPPDPPLPPRPRGPRLLAWLGVVACPALLLVLALAGMAIRSTFSTLLVMWFLGGFLYLVWQMPHEPGDPSDNGARL